MTVELLAPEGATLESAAGAVAGAFTVREGPIRAHDRSYYDSFDGLLHQAGLTLEHERGALVLAEPQSARVRARQSLRRPTRPLLLSDLPAGPVRDALAPVIGVRALLPLVRLNSRERALAVLDAEEKTVAHVVVSAPAVPSVDHSVVLLRPRAILTGVRGYDDELAHVQDMLVGALGFEPAGGTVLEEAVRARGGTRGRVGAQFTSAKVGVALVRGEPGDSAAAAVLTRLLEIIEANLEGTLADIDTEFLHDLRVAVRRSRSVQRELRSVFTPLELAHFRAEFRWVQAATGPARDLDIHVLEFDQYRAMVGPQFRDDLDPVLEVLRERRHRALRDMRRALRSERFQRLRTEWADYLAALPVRELDGRPDAKRPIDELASARISKVYRRMVREGRAISAESPAEALHELRKQGKELRYLFELFGVPLYGEETVRPMIKALKGLQDVLGRHQDRAVQVGLMATLTDEVGRRPGGSGALVALGALMQRLIDDEHAARAEFAERFAAFASRTMRGLVKEALS